MRFRLKYIMMFIMLVSSLSAFAQQRYIIEDVCVGSVRNYKIDGEPDATFEWTLTDPGGVVSPITGTIDQITIDWSVPIGAYIITCIQTNEEGCFATELGTVNVIVGPSVFAGNDVTLCNITAGSTYTLSDATADNNGELLWTTSGNGTFDDATILNPTYTFTDQDIAAGNVTLTVTAQGLGAEGSCPPASASITITLGTLLAEATTTPAGCTGVNNGTLQINASGSSGTLTYSLNGVDDPDGDGLFTDLAPGPYNWAVTDGICTVTGTADVLVLDPITATITHIDETIGGLSDGIISILNVTGGSGSYEYSYDNGLTWYPTSTFNGLPPGNYTVIVRDVLNPDCTSEIYIVDILPGLEILAVVDNHVTCYDGTDGQATVTASGGDEPYTYLWDDPLAQTTATATGLSAGFYTVIVTDVDGTELSAEVEITQPEELVVVVTGTDPTTIGGNDGTATATVSGGVPPYSYLWDDPLAQTTATATNLIAGDYTVIVTDANGCTADATVTLTDPQAPLAVVIVSFTDISCFGANDGEATAEASGGTEPYNYVWMPGGMTGAAVTGLAPGLYTVTVTDADGNTATAEVTITEPAPVYATFDPIGPLCQNSVAPDLPLVSLENITGTWVPAVIATDVAGTFTYTFTPNPDQCGEVVTMDIEIVPEIIPTFVQIGPLCLNSTAPDLPLISDNGITGTWSPATINTSTVGTTTYTFTPDDPDQCGVVTTMDITIDDEILPTFDQIGPLCLNSPAPTLPTTSLEGITGTWSPATINTNTVGTTTYTFTPDDPNQCGVVTTMDITIDDEILPTFDQIGPLCLNSPAPTLPSTSLEGITGTWSPATINTSTVGTATYTFTPDDPNQCGVVTTMDITIDDEILPTFDQIGPLCLNSPAPTLPSTSLEGITGTWSPATINTSTVGTATYTFTPDDPNQCGVVTTMDIEIVPEIIPTFVQIGPLCLNSTPPDLPLISDNGITGTWSPATINTNTGGTTTYTFTPDDPNQCGVVTTMDIEIVPEIVPTFVQIGPLCLNSTAPDLPLISDNGITGTWSPATINTNTVGTTTYTFTPDDPNQCGVVTTMDIEIVPEIIPTFVQIGPLCLNSTAPDLPLISDNGITGTWLPATINTTIVGTTTYTFTPDDPDQCGVVTTMDIEIVPEIIPTFVQIGPLCLNSTAPDLPLISDNGITGTWLPATINTTIVGTTTYTFTPDDPDQCGVVTTMDIEIVPEIIPTFVQIGPLCLNSTAPDLPLTSDNGITGTWTPATINTNTVGTTTYTFTPDDPNQCGVVTTMDIEIVPEIVPTFVQIGPLCLNSTAPDLPLISDNGITGTWLPATINTSAVGTTTYTFTPDDPNQCGVLTTMDIEIVPEIVPTFAQIGPLCLNSTAPDLPLTSDNGITGTWSPTTINTNTVGTTTYTFTPDDPNQCGVVTTMDIEIVPEIVPTFVQIGPLCLNSTAPDLPLISDNGITGTWSPATINTTIVGTTTYTFTPDDPNQCGVVTTMDIEIVPEIVPTFVQIGPLCLNSLAPTLPATSLEGITGTWSPAAINTNTVGTTTYTFTPDDPNQCGVVTTMDITIDDEILPTFDQIGPLCLNSPAPTLPTTSLEGITGTWSPATINTNTVGTTTYTFTPDDPNQCGVVTTMDITIDDEILPTFDQIGPLCLNSPAPTLPSTSLEGITGTWSPATINTSTVGTATYTFTPDDPNQCGVVTTMDITIDDEILPTFDQIGPLCLNSPAPTLPSTSLEGITGTWSPATINTTIIGTTTYTFTPDDPDQCGIQTTMDITIDDEILPTFDQIGPLCLNSPAPTLPSTSLEGITGTWSPATINTSTVGTATYTFTPDDPNQCGVVTTMDITIDDEILPTFDQIGPLCLNSPAPTLPSTSLEGITGTWSPATINTNTVGTTTYTFTPDDPDQCGVVTTMDITIDDEILPTFDQIGPLCLNSTAPDLPLTSLEGITGTWSPATINTNTVGSTTYTFTPTDPCGVPFSMVIVIDPLTTPAFTAIGTLCLNSTPPVLETTSLNGITGTWSPATINTAIAATTSHTFTPDAGQCAEPLTISITVDGPVIVDIVVRDATNGSSNGQVTISATGGTGQLEYSLDGITWQTSPIFIDLAPGNYTAYVRDAAGCQTSGEFTVGDVILGEITLIPDRVLQCVGEEGHAPIYVIDFKDVKSFRIQLTYDPNILTFTGLFQTHPNLTVTSISHQLIAPGLLEVRYTEPTSTLQIPDNETLITLSFLGAAPGRTELNWNFIECVIYNPDNFEIPHILPFGIADVVAAPDISITSDGTEFCEGESVVLAAHSLDGQQLKYQWTHPRGFTFNGPEWEFPQLSVLDAGTYTLSASNESCGRVKTIDVTVYPAPQPLISHNEELCFGNPVMLDAGGIFAEYEWSKGPDSSLIISYASAILAEEADIYRVKVTDTRGCTAFSEVTLIPCVTEIMIPNAFTPDGDGLNDIFRPIFTEGSFNPNRFNMSIYTKWGQLIYTSGDASQGWDGTYMGQPVMADTYVYMISYEVPSYVTRKEDRAPLTGTVNLLRKD